MFWSTQAYITSACLNSCLKVYQVANKPYKGILQQRVKKGYVSRLYLTMLYQLLLKTVLMYNN